MKAMRDAWGEKLVELGRSDPRTVVLDGDLANSTKADNSTEPIRGFFQMGIEEPNLIGRGRRASVGFVLDLLVCRVLNHRASTPSGC